jgi:CRP-like cAMP-binding protein
MARTNNKTRGPSPAQTPCGSCPLRQIKAFRKFSAVELDFMQSFKGGELVLDAGSTILVEGTNSPHLYTLLSGWAIKHKSLEDGRRQVLNYALPGDFLGLQGSIFESMHHSVEALTGVVLCVFPREKLWTLYEKHQGLAFDVTWLAARRRRSSATTLSPSGSGGDRAGGVCSSAPVPPRPPARARPQQQGHLPVHGTTWRTP